MIIQSATLDYHDKTKYIRLQRYKFFGTQVIKIKTLCHHYAKNITFAVGKK